MSGKGKKGKIEASEFTTLKSRTIRYGEQQFVRVSLQQIQGKKILVISRGYRNKNETDIIKSSVVISYREVAQKTSEQIQQLLKDLPSVKKNISKTQKNKNDSKDIEIKL